MFKGVLDRICYDIIIHSSNISAAKHVRFITCSCKVCYMLGHASRQLSSMWWFNDPGCCRSVISTNRLHAFCSRREWRDWKIMYGLVPCLHLRGTHVGSAYVSLAINSHIVLSHCKRTGKLWLSYAQKEKNDQILMLYYYIIQCEDHKEKPDAFSVKILCLGILYFPIKMNKSP